MSRGKGTMRSSVMCSIRTGVIFAALVAAVSSNDPDDATVTSLRAFGVFLLWCRMLRVLLVSPKFGPFVLMFFRMLFGDVLNYLVLLLFVIVAFAAGWWWGLCHLIRLSSRLTGFS